MSMSKGSVTINSETGEASGSGAAKALFDELDAKTDYQGSTGAVLAAARQRVATLCESFAEIIDYIKDNAEITLDGTAHGVASGSSDADVDGTGTLA